jgi:hypothetical protein
VNVNVLFVAVHSTVALLNVTYALLSIISVQFNSLVLNHTESVHVSTIIHEVPLFIGVLLGIHHVHTGGVLSFQFAVSTVSCVSVTVVGVTVVLVGVSHAFTVHHEKIYPLAVFGIALILGDAQYLYTHLHVTSGHQVKFSLHMDGLNVPFTKSYIQYTPLLFLHGT